MTNLLINIRHPCVHEELAGWATFRCQAAHRSEPVRYPDEIHIPGSPLTAYERGGPAQGAEPSRSDSRWAGLLRGPEQFDADEATPWETKFR